MSAVLLSIWLVLAGVQGGEVNPHTSTEDVAEGERVYGLHCAECHGVAGAGGRGPNLSNGEFYHGETDVDLYGIILNGIPGTEMLGAFDGKKRVWQLVAYLRSLSPVAEELPGNPGKGEALFRGKNCFQCHRVGAEGGYGGPDLTEVGGRRSLAHLEASILRPNDEVLPHNWIATVKSQTGGSASGFIVNQDTHSLLLRDLSGRLRAFNKAELDDFRVSRDSMMQSYDRVFNDGDLADLLSYLASLRKERAR